MIKTSRPLVSVAAVAVLGSLSVTPATAKPAGTWREVSQSSAAAYDPLDPAFEKMVIEKFHVPSSMMEGMRIKPPVSGTLRTRFAVASGGSQLRIRISNDAGSKPMRVEQQPFDLAS